MRTTGYSYCETGILVVGFVATMLTGCQEPNAEKPPEDTPQTIVADDVLLHQLDDVLTATYERRLTLRDHATWQILHGALAYQRDFLVERDGEMVSAVDYLLDGGTMKGWDVEPGEYGPRVLLAEGSKTGQGHYDQWFANFAQCDLQLSQTLKVADRTYSMADFVEQVKWDVPRNTLREYSWTLIGLTKYVPPDAKWVASDGKEWSIERLLASELEQDLATSACGGTHRLMAIAVSLNRHLARGGELEGVWQRAEETVQRAIQTTRRFQNPDGFFSTSFFERPGTSPDVGLRLGSTGHILEFVTLATSDQQLKESWIRQAAINLCDLLQSTKDVALECGALYHAAHGLVLYRARIFGPRRYGTVERPKAGAGKSAATGAAVIPLRK